MHSLARNAPGLLCCAVLVHIRKTGLTVSATLTGLRVDESRRHRDARPPTDRQQMVSIHRDDGRRIRDALRSLRVGVVWPSGEKHVAT